jgi:selenocysteine lyase/cysteine desulfurase
MPESSPERYEAGTLATPSIVGLSEGIRILNSIGVESVARKEAELVARLRERLWEIPEIVLYAPRYEGGILLFNVKGIPSEQVGNMLNRRGFCVRAGYHCAALGHKTLETPDGGAVRVSPGWFNTFRQIDTLSDTIREICRQP